MKASLRAIAIAAISVPGFIDIRTVDAQAAAPDTPASPASAELSAFSIDTLRKTLSDASGLRRQGMLKRLCDSIPVDQYAAAFAEISKAGIESTELLPIFFASWREKDPAAAVAGAEPLLTTKDAGVFRKTFSYWASKDSAAARKFAEHLPAPEKKGAIAMLDRNNPTSPGKTSVPTANPRERFWSIIEITPHSLSSKEPYEPILREWVLSDPEGAAKEILGSPALRNYSDVLKVIYEGWKSKDPGGAERFLANLNFDERRRMIARIGEELAVKDVAMARKTAEILKEPKERAFALTRIGVRLARDNPSVAPEWIRLAAEADPTFVAGSLFAEWFEHEPAKAAKALLANEAYQLFLKKYPEEPLVGKYVNLLPYAEQDPRGAAQFVAMLPAADLQKSLYRMAQNWVKKGGTGALEWARSVPAGPAQDEALRQFTFSVAKLNANQATKHLDALPAGTAKSAGIEGFAFATFDIDPDAALVWVRAIPNEKQRLDVLGRAWSDWRKKNARAAQDWARNVAQFQPAERAALEERGAF
jgi:hypothetical protein